MMHRNYAGLCMYIRAGSANKHCTGYYFAIQDIGKSRIRQCLNTSYAVGCSITLPEDPVRHPLYLVPNQSLQGNSRGMWQDIVTNA